ncbi:MAG: hypothetical protein O2779_03135 [Nanoarchaeota archaeon]|nr:hypothetical protein [Nanoarchaeota archaeon]
MEDMDQYGYIEDEPENEVDNLEDTEDSETAKLQESQDDDEFELDEVKGSHGKKPKMALLNKKKVGGYEMDELFLDF